MNKYKQYLDNNEYEFVSYSKNEFENGGLNYNNPNASLEKKEIFMKPNGSINGVNAGSHESGNDANINIPQGTKILSDKLKMNGKTFAKLGAKYTTNKEDKIMSDDKATSSSKATAKLTSEIKQRKLDELFSAQESMKQTKLSGYAKKLGIDIPQQEFRNGGIKQYADGGNHIGDVKYGSYVNGQWEAFPVQKTYAQSTPEGTFNSKGEMTSLPYGRTLIEPIESKNINPFTEEQDKFNPVYKNESSPGYNYSMNLGDEKSTTDYSQYANIASGIAQSAGAINGLITNKPQPAVQYKKPSIKYLDPRAELRSNANSNAGVVNSIKEYSGGNAEQYMRSRIIQGSNNSQTNAATINKYDNYNSEIYNRNQSESASIDNKGIDATAADQARTRDLQTNYIGQIGSNAANMYRDNRLTNQDNESLAIISSMYPDYEYNKSKRGWYHKANGSKLNPKSV